MAREGREVARVVHEVGGEWRFACAEEHGAEATFEEVALEVLAERQPSLRTLSDLQPGWSASLREWGWLRESGLGSFGGVSGRGCGH